MAEQKVVGLTPNPPAPDDWVEMTHEGIERSMRCSPRAVPHWEVRGWTLVESDVDAPVTAEQVAADRAAKTQARSAGTES